MNKSLHLLYHELRPGGSAYQYVVSSSAFEAHCRLYARLQADPGSCLRPEITFDDGHISDLRQALPILQSYALRARFFITAGWTATRHDFMNWADLRELQQAGQHIGAHGMTHKLLTRCSSVELQEELAGARKRLEDGLGTAVESMSLPGGRANRRVLDACRASGFTQVFTSEPQVVAMDAAPEVIGRLNVTATATVADIEGLLTPTSGQLLRVHRMHRAKSVAKAALGDGLYGRLWALLNRHETPEPGEEA